MSDRQREREILIKIVRWKRDDTEIPNLSIVTANTNLAAVELDLINLENYENILLNKICFTRYLSPIHKTLSVAVEVGSVLALSLRLSLV